MYFHLEYDWYFEMIFFEFFLSLFLFLIKSSIIENNLLLVKLSKYIAAGLVSIRPPFLEMIVAQPLDPASIDVLPNGSSQNEGAIEMLVSL